MLPKTQTLPAEIYEQIVNYLPTNDRVTCLSVCKSWNTHLYRTIIRVITITSRKQIKCLIAQIQKYKPIGNSIKELHFRKRVGLTPFEFTFICQHCPSLEVFKFTNWQNYKNENFASLPQLKQITKLYDEKKGFHAIMTAGQSLTHLEISELLLRRLVPVRMHMLLIQQTPHLTDLTLDGPFSLDPDQEDPRRLEFNYIDWNLIHEHCPHLTSIKMTSVSLNATPIEAKEMEGVADVVPNMKRLVLKSLFFNNPAWFHYIAFLYPNLIELELDFNVGCFLRLSDTSSRVDVQECQTAFMLLAHQLTKLKKIKLRGIQKTHFPGMVFFGIMEMRGVELEEVYVSYSTNVFAPSGIDARVYNSLVYGQHKSLRSLDIDIWNISHEGSFKSIIEPLSLCTRLTELYLCNDDFTGHFYSCIPIDLILDGCPGLVELSLSRISVSVEDKHSRKRSHPLRKLCLSASKISQPLFDYLSVRCVKIRRLVLFSCSWMPMELEMKIDMPNNNFEYIQITDMNASKTTALEGNLMDGHAVNLFRVSRLDAIAKRKQRYEKSDTNPMYMASDTPLASSWYHLYETPPSGRYFTPSELRKLSKWEVLQSHYLLEYIERNQHKCRPRKFQEFETHYINKRGWKADLAAGYVHIICKSLDTIKYNFNSVTFK